LWVTNARSPGFRQGRAAIRRASAQALVGSRLKTNSGRERLVLADSCFGMAPFMRYIRRGSSTRASLGKMGFMDDLEGVVEHLDGARLSVDELHLAIEHLYAAIEKLESVESVLSSGAIDIMELEEKLADSWLEVNRCRIYTESIVCLEELVIPAMGLINDAKCMVESCVAWQLGLTQAACRNIVHAIGLAVEEGLRPALEELECWVSEATQ